MRDCNCGNMAHAGDSGPMMWHCSIHGKSARWMLSSYLSRVSIECGLTYEECWDVMYQAIRLVSTYEYTKGNIFDEWDDWKMVADNLFNIVYLHDARYAIEKVEDNPRILLDQYSDSLDTPYQDLIVVLIILSVVGMMVFSLIG